MPTDGDLSARSSARHTRKSTRARRRRDANLAKESGPSRSTIPALPGNTDGIDRAPSERKRVDTLTVVTLAVVTVPILIAVVRLSTIGHVYLSADLALTDLRVHDALGLRQLVGPFDRFGWHHPGPMYFYLLAAVHLVVRDGGRSEYIGAALINLASALTTVWVVRHRAGRWASLWAALCLGAIGLTLTQSIPNVDERLGILLGPWNPDVVVFPLILFGVLCAVGAVGSWGALVGAALVGTFTVQTDISTLPVVTVLLVGGVLAIIVRTRRARQGVPRLTLGIGAAAFVALWLPPIIQQADNHPGNLTLLWRFFTGAHSHYGLASSLKSVLAADQYLIGFPNRIPIGTLPQLSDPHAWTILVVMAVAGLVGAVLGSVRKRPLAVALGLASLVGLVVSVYAATHIVGPVFPYLLQWEIALPVLAAIGLGVAALRGNPHAALKALILGGTAALIVGFSLAMIRLPMSDASDRPVAQAWHIIAPHLHHDATKTVFVDTYGNGDQSTLWGLLDQLEEHGFHPVTSALWRVAVGTDYVTKHRQSVYIFLYAPARSVEAMPGYVGHVKTADIVITETPPKLSPASLS